MELVTPKVGAKLILLFTLVLSYSMGLIYLGYVRYPIRKAYNKASLINILQGDQMWQNFTIWATFLKAQEIFLRGK